jgi:hypothetical protein
MFPSKTGTRSGDDRAFGSADVSRIARVSLRQLQWWDERRVASPREKEHRRVWSAKTLADPEMAGCQRSQRAILSVHAALNARLRGRPLLPNGDFGLARFGLPARPGGTLAYCLGG